MNSCSWIRLQNWKFPRRYEYYNHGLPYQGRAYPRIRYAKSNTNWNYLKGHNQYQTFFHVKFIFRIIYYLYVINMITHRVRLSRTPSSTSRRVMTRLELTVQRLEIMILKLTDLKSSFYRSKYLFVHLFLSWSTHLFLNVDHGV